MKEGEHNTDIQQVVDMLLLNGTLTDCPGLIHGKMGIAIFFFYYAQCTDNLLFADYALDLIREMQEQIHINSSADYEKGIAGIGVGIDYLVRNKFLIAEDDICEDFDQRMYRAVMYDPWQDFSKYDGLIGYGKYWISRIHQTPSMQARECLLYIVKRIQEELSNIPINEQIDVYCFLHDLQEISDFDICIRVLEQCQKWNLQSIDINRCFSHLGNTAIGNIIRKHQHSWYFNETLQSDIDLKQISDLRMGESPVSMGLLTGYAGEGLLRLTALQQMSKSWIFLL